MNEEESAFVFSKKRCPNCESFFFGGLFFPLLAGFFRRDSRIAAKLFIETLNTHVNIAHFLQCVNRILA